MMKKSRKYKQKLCIIYIQKINTLVYRAKTDRFIIGGGVILGTESCRFIGQNTIDLFFEKKKCMNGKE